ncbi:MAG: hypothetical protein AB7O48_04570 [Cyclobacteriaceae bacterium]
MKTKFIIAIAAQGVIILCLVVYAFYQRTEVKVIEEIASKWESIALANEKMAQHAVAEAEHQRDAAQHAMQEADRQRLLCEEHIKAAARKR